MRPTESPLGSREREVLDLMATGASPREIATELVVPVETVQSHEQHICASSKSTRGRRRS
jgi:ATP/maltotriose-dependent transcriptional regulator MalT